MTVKNNELIELEISEFDFITEVVDMNSVYETNKPPGFLNLASKSFGFGRVALSFLTR